MEIGYVPAVVHPQGFSNGWCTAGSCSPIGSNLWVVLGHVIQLGATSLLFYPQNVLAGYALRGSLG